MSWTYDPETREICDVDGPIAVVFEDGHSVEVVGDGPDDAISERAHEAGRMMAAAPELLAACKAFVSLAQTSDMRPEDECLELLRSMRAAIAKVEGK